jgi:hypothetical protein
MQPHNHNLVPEFQKEEIMVLSPSRLHDEETLSHFSVSDRGGYENPAFSELLHFPEMESEEEEAFFRTSFRPNWWAFGPTH